MKRHLKVQLLRDRVKNNTSPTTSPSKVWDTILRVQTLKFAQPHISYEGQL